MKDKYPALRLIRGVKQQLEVLYIFSNASVAGFGVWLRRGWLQVQNMGKERQGHEFQLPGIS